ncbi:MAG TPA: substrate-binding domain-containing protein [Kofleriaceae bacterium]|jgi:D-xylose transport system substrate-binding protein|nr:substrate-binding domain-containing protein [Kofleriaceae bacterium]
MLIAIVAVAPGCGKGDKSNGGGSGSAVPPASGGGSSTAPAAAGGGGGGSIALLLPESQTARYEAADKPFFEKKFKELCPNVDIVYSNANQVAADQQQQAEAAIARGVKVMVLDPVDGDAAGAIVKNAKTKSIPVISYDRLIKGGSSPDYYISFDNEGVGKLQAQALLDKLTSSGVAKPKITMINGSPTDNNATLFKTGAHSVFDGKVTIVKEDAAANWKPEEAQQLMEQFIAAVGKDGFDGAYQANDGTSGGAIAAMKAAGIDPTKRPTVGQDAELAAIQRILAGEQYATIYKRIQPEAEKTAELACALFKGAKPADGVVNSKVNNGTGDVPSVLLVPVAVSLAGGGVTQSVADTVVKDKFYGPDTVAQICKGYEAACKSAKIQ